MSVPVMSIGIRSGVNWMRLNLSDIVSASLLTSSVLARPGTPISSAWPRANRQIDKRSITRSCPTMTRPQFLSQPIVGVPQPDRSPERRLHLTAVSPVNLQP